MRLVWVGVGYDKHLFVVQNPRERKHSLLKGRDPKSLTISRQWAEIESTVAKRGLLCANRGQLLCLSVEEASLVEARSAPECFAHCWVAAAAMQALLCTVIETGD